MCVSCLSLAGGEAAAAAAADADVSEVEYNRYGMYHTTYYRWRKYEIPSRWNFFSRVPTP